MGGNHPVFARSLEGYAELLRNLGRRSEAARADAEAELIRRRVEAGMAVPMAAPGG
jgi:hypothetical protein